MEKEALFDLLETYISEDCRQIVVSGPRKKTEKNKIKIRPVMIKDTLMYQVTQYCGKQVFHENMDKHALMEAFQADYVVNYKQVQLTHKECTITALIGKKGQVTISKKKIKTALPVSLDHNRSKRYLIEEGTAVPFMVDLGVMTPEGKVVQKKYDKFRQINRFLEFVRDIVPQLPKDRKCTILDFGCGKSYLTFAMYYYLHELCKLDVLMIGLDLKEDVIAHCEQLAHTYGYENLHFLTGDIKDYEGVNEVDMVVTLHACDTATDYALYKAVTWNAGVILSVPCCQHELNAKIQNETLSPMLKYGILKERFSALATDAMRAELLMQMGYDTQLLEFIDMEHTPKNILIRAVQTSKQSKPVTLSKEYCAFRSALSDVLTFERLLKEDALCEIQSLE